LGKYTLEIEYDYDFVLIGISSHEKDYRFCWALNNKLKLELSKKESLEIKGKKQVTPSYFSFFTFDDKDQYTEYSVIANFSESKSLATAEDTLFGKADVSKHNDQSENEFLIPEHKKMNYFFVINGERDDEEVEALIQQIKEIDIVLTAIRIDPKTLRSKQNLIF
jgi:Cft2 family RNA processing exonuclease